MLWGYFKSLAPVSPATTILNFEDSSDSSNGGR